jgi:hypothetical protein
MFGPEYGPVHGEVPDEVPGKMLDPHHPTRLPDTVQNGTPTSQRRNATNASAGRPGVPAKAASGRVTDERPALIGPIGYQPLK